MRLSSISPSNPHEEHSQNSSGVPSVHVLRLENLTWRLSATESRRNRHTLAPSLRGLVEDHHASRFNSPHLHFRPAKAHSPSMRRGSPRSRRSSPLRPCLFHRRSSPRGGSLPRSVSVSNSPAFKVNRASPGVSPRRCVSPRRSLAAGRPRRLQRSPQNSSPPPPRKIAERSQHRTPSASASADTRSAMMSLRSSHEIVCSNSQTSPKASGRLSQDALRLDVGVRAKAKDSSKCRTMSTPPAETIHSVGDSKRVIPQASELQPKQRMQALTCMLPRSEPLPVHATMQRRQKSNGDLRVGEKKKVSFSDVLAVEVPIITSRKRISRTLGATAGDRLPPRRAEDQARANLARLVANNQRVIRRSSEWSRRAEHQARASVYHCTTCTCGPEIGKHARRLAARIHSCVKRKLSSHVALSDDILFICSQRGTLEKTVSLGGAEVLVSDTMVAIDAKHDQGCFQLHLGSVEDAARWASELQAAADLLETTLRRRPKQDAQGKFEECARSVLVGEELRWTQLVVSEQGFGLGATLSSPWKLCLASVMQAACPQIWRSRNQ